MCVRVHLSGSGGEGVQRTRCRRLLLFLLLLCDYCVCGVLFLKASPCTCGISITLLGLVHGVLSCVIVRDTFAQLIITEVQ